MRALGTLFVLTVIAGGVIAAVYNFRPTTEETKTVTVLAAPESGPLSGALPDDQYAVKVGNRQWTRQDELTRPEPEGQYRVNLSPAVMMLDVDVVDPNTEPPLATVYPTYHDAYAAAQTLGGSDPVETLPSASMVYSLTRSFDQGLIAAVELALLRGNTDSKVGVIPVLKELFHRLPNTSKVRPYLAAVLDLAGEKDVKVFPDEVSRKVAALSGFRNRTLVYAPPVDHYAWTEETRQCYRVTRYLQDAFPTQTFRVATELAEAFRSHPDLLKQYDQVVRAFEVLFQERKEFLVLDLARLTRVDDGTIREMTDKHLDYIRRLQVLPDSRRREIIHFSDFLPMGFLPDLDLFPELIQRSRIGFVSVVNPGSQQPRIEQLQAVALDLFLAESARSPEAPKTLFSRTFHERLLGPHFAVKREVDERELAELETPVPWRPGDRDRICPRLRVEPVPAFYLRLARNYPHIASALEQVVGKETFRRMKRLTPEGSYVSESMVDEIARMTRTMYGLYLITCEDLAIAPTFNAGEQPDRDACIRDATDWLSRAFDDEAARRDVRFSTPIDFRPESRNVVLWSCIGVRMHKLSVRFAPEALPYRQGLEEGSVPLPAEKEDVGVARYILPVLELAGLEVTNRFGLDPKEFSSLCDGVAAGLRDDAPKIHEAIAQLESADRQASAESWKVLKAGADVHNRLKIPHETIDLKPLEDELRRNRGGEGVARAMERAWNEVLDALRADAETINARDAYVNGIRHALKAMQPPAGGALPGQEGDKEMPVPPAPGPGPAPTNLPGLPDPISQPANPGVGPGAGLGPGIGGLPE